MHFENQLDKLQLMEIISVLALKAAYFAALHKPAYTVLAFLLFLPLFLSFNMLHCISNQIHFQCQFVVTLFLNADIVYPKVLRLAAEDILLLLDQFVMLKFAMQLKSGKKNTLKLYSKFTINSQVFLDHRLSSMEFCSCFDNWCLGDDKQMWSFKTFKTQNMWSISSLINVRQKMQPY